jgi:peptidoglycan L-alanyl-D-glutamate endopeptidase CwlK
MPFAFGSKSKLNLKGVHPALVRVAERAIALSEQDFMVHDGLRTMAEQRANVASGASQTLDSKHLPQGDGLAHAVDLVPWIGGAPKWDWPAIYVIAEAVHQAAKELGTQMVWGAVWDRSFLTLPGDRAGLKAAMEGYGQRRRAMGKKKVFYDGPHYQLD